MVKRPETHAEAVGRRPGFWMRRAIDGIRGASQAMFPENDIGAPDWRETDMVERSVDWLEEVPWAQRRLLLLLFIFIEMAAPLLFVGFHRFSRCRVERRTRAIARWRASRFYLLRILGDALKAAMMMTYMSHPAVLHHIGLFKHCENPSDPMQVPIRATTLDEAVR